MTLIAIKELKRVLRQFYRRLRLRYAGVEFSCSSVWHGHLLSALEKVIQKQGCVYVGAYFPYDGEPNIESCLRVLSEKFDDHVIFLYPCVEKRGDVLKFFPWREGEPLQKGVGGTKECVRRDQEGYPDLLFLPCVAFDQEGHRLGYGGGYYDRTFAFWKSIGHSYISVGVSFSGQFSWNLPTEHHDCVLDCIMTEKFLWTLGRQG